MTILMFVLLLGASVTGFGFGFKALDKPRTFGRTVEASTLFLIALTTFAIAGYLIQAPHWK